MAPVAPSPILVVAAHPDDEVLGCGGTLALRAAEGTPVYVAILGEGATSRHAAGADAATRETSVLARQARQAGALLGATEVHTFGLPDNRFDTVPLLDIVKRVEELVGRVRPGVVFTHHGGDLNIDHAVTCRAVLTATRPTPGHPVREVYAFEVPSSTGWAFGRPGGPFEPNVFIDIGPTLSTKLRALEVYSSEGRPFPHARSPEALEALARHRGSLVGLGAAEAFRLLRSVVPAGPGRVSPVS
ncbi:MAG: PIG-L family deacetylase [Deferrisomatales bacterium]